MSNKLVQCEFFSALARQVHEQLLVVHPDITVQLDGVVDIGRLVDAWVDEGVDETEVYQLIASEAGIPFEKPVDRFEASATFLDRIPIAYARQIQLIGAASDDGTTIVYVCNARGLDKLETVDRRLNCPVSPRLTSSKEIDRLINHAYQQRDSQTESIISTFDRDSVLGELDPSSGKADLLDGAGQTPVIKLVNMILFDAVRSDASDVHIQPYEDRMVVRFRIDGVLFDQFDVPKTTQEEVTSRVKVMGKMNIAEKRLPQDGRATVQAGDRLIDLRIASLPTSFGERVVIRLLDKSARLYTLGELGMGQDILVEFRRLIHREHGMILVTGPTGGGKSTTLYAALQEINSKDRNIVTLEDPIEYQLSGISQTQINEKKGMTFATGLRSILRQDPDIIMVGEIRDQETAEMAIQSALTGHMVFSTLHTNDAASAVTRLLDLGIEPYLVASSVVGVLAQRLVRRICKNCSREVTVDRASIDNAVAQELGTDCTHIMHGPGCTECLGTGYRGRLGLFELMQTSEGIESLIQRRENASTIRHQAIEDGMQLLRRDGIDKVRKGFTSIEEVMRVSALGNGNS